MRRVVSNQDVEQRERQRPQGKEERAEGTTGSEDDLSDPGTGMRVVPLRLDLGRGSSAHSLLPLGFLDKG